MITNPICNKCRHFCLNHGDGTGIGCKAFPNGIPDEAMCNHYKKIAGQKGEPLEELALYINV